MGKIVYLFSKLVLILSLFLLIACYFVACHTNHYFNSEGVYYSENPRIELIFPEKCGMLELEGTTYELSMGFSNDGTYLNLYDKILLSQAERDVQGHLLDADAGLLWKTDTVVKSGKLYLTVTKDNISDYEGKTIVLEFKPT